MEVEHQNPNILPHDDVAPLPSPPLDPFIFIGDDLPIPDDLFAADFDFNADDFDFNLDDPNFIDNFLPELDYDGLDSGSGQFQPRIVSSNPNLESDLAEIGGRNQNFDDRGLSSADCSSFRLLGFDSTEISGFNSNFDDRYLIVADCSNFGIQRSSDGARVWNYSQESDNCDLLSSWHVSTEESGDRHLNCQSSGSDSTEIRAFNSNFHDRALNAVDCSNVGIDQNSDGARVWNYSQESDTCDWASSGNVLTQESGDRVLNFRSLGSEFNQKRNCLSSDCAESNSALSQAVSSHSHDSGNNSNNHQDILPSALNGVVDSKTNGLDVASKCISKRKKEHEDVNVETRTSKLRKSSATIIESRNLNVGSEEEEKRKARLIRNRESAQLSRQRKKQYVEVLEDKVRLMNSTITELNGKISYIMAENASLRQQLSGASNVCPPPPPGMYPMAPGAYPWVPCAPYMVKPLGSQVPLVPIPRLRPEQPPAPKVNKKPERKKREGKTKKMASISFLGVLFFVLLFGGLVPVVNDRFSSYPKGKIVMVDHWNGTDYGVGMRHSNGRFGNESQLTHQSDGLVPKGNSSESLVASLYVPRNDKLVKIDGNLIIHSVLASERTSESDLVRELKVNEETSLAIATNYGPRYPIHGVGVNNDGNQRALGPGFADELKSAMFSGKQQWFREGLAGPMLSSGMCTEIFQFDISPTSGAIAPATRVSNTRQSGQNSTRLNVTEIQRMTKNRRILHPLPLPLPLGDPKLNTTEETDQLKINKAQSSMVVSVLVDPREVGDSDGEIVITTKALSRIFVVVLIDSVKYVTYSCRLPFMGSGPHLVTT